MILHSTGRADTHPCDLCGLAVEHREVAQYTFGEGREWWWHTHPTTQFPMQHLAPCGLPCLAGGVRRGEERHGRECEKCNQKEEW